MSEGHADAGWYPYNKLLAEAAIVQERNAKDRAAEVTVYQTAMVSIMSAKGGKEFKKAVERLTGYDAVKGND